SKQQQLQDACKAIADALNKVLSETEDPLILVTQEIERLEADLTTIRAAVEQGNGRLNAMEDGLDKAKQILAVLRLKMQINELGGIKECSEYQELVAARRQLHILGDL